MTYKISIFRSIFQFHNLPIAFYTKRFLSQNLSYLLLNLYVLILKWKHFKMEIEEKMPLPIVDNVEVLRQIAFS